MPDIMVVIEVEQSAALQKYSHIKNIPGVVSIRKKCLKTHV